MRANLLHGIDFSRTTEIKVFLRVAKIEKINTNIHKCLSNNFFY